MKQPEFASQQPAIDFQETTKRFNKELTEMSSDFFNKIGDIQEQINKIYQELFNIKNIPKQEIDEDVIVRKVLQKMPISTNNHGPLPQIDKESIIKEVLSRVPRSVGNAVYEVAPLEKITKGFLEEAKNFVISNVGKLDDEQKKMLKYVETQGSGQKLGTVIEKCLFKSQTSGGTRDSIGKKLKDMANIELIRYDAAHGLYYPALKDTITKYCGQHSATPQEIESVYSHILLEMLK